MTHTEHYSPEQLDGTLITRMGIELDQVGPDGATGRMPVAGNTQPAGLLHGGASAVLAETLASVAAHAHASATASAAPRTAAGVDLNITHHRAVRGGWVHGRAEALYLGGRTASYEIIITDDDGARVATGRLTCQLITVR